MATISTQNKDKKNFKHSLTKEEIKEKKYSVYRGKTR